MTQGDLFNTPPVQRPTDTLTVARKRIRDDIDKGSICPCCDQNARRYKHRISSLGARGLMWLIRKSAATDRGWVDVTGDGPRWLVKGGGTFAKMAHWGLIVQKYNDDSTKKDSGIWRPTSKGWRYANCKEKVTEYVLLYNKGVEGFTGDDVDIKHALGKKFNYEDLMAGKGS